VPRSKGNSEWLKQEKNVLRGVFSCKKIQKIDYFSEFSKYIWLYQKKSVTLQPKVAKRDMPSAEIQKM
jgi:hypothetical protein